MHFYDRAGNPRHTVLNATGKERPSTTRDARKHGWFASVSTVMSVASEDAIVNWTCEQIIDAAWACPYTGGDVKEWKQKIRKLSKVKRESAAKDGNIIHKAMEVHFEGVRTEMDHIVIPASQLLQERFGDVEWMPEETFALDFGGGFGGCVDLHSKEGNGIVIDFKTQATGDIKNFRFYKKYLMQISAYRIGLGLDKADCYIMKISSTHPGVLQLKKYKEEDLERAFNSFYHLLKYFNIENKLGVVDV